MKENNAMFAPGVYAALQICFFAIKFVNDVAFHPENMVKFSPQVARNRR